MARHAPRVIRNPQITKHAIEALLERAVASVARADTAFTADTTQTEWNIAHHLAMAIHRHLKVRQLDCDVDLRKPGYGGRRPDIVFHKRGIHRANVLVVELKHAGTRRAVNADVRKIKEYWFAPPLSYRFGAAINVRQGDASEVIVLRNPSRTRPRPRAKRRYPA